MLLNKKNLAIAALACKEQSRYQINGIQVTKEGTAVTDGHIAVRVSVPTNHEVKDFPVIDGLKDLKQPDFILATDAALKIASAIPKEKSLEILNHAQVGETASGKLAIGVTDLDNAQIFQPKKIEGQFPGLDAVWPADNKQGMTIMADANLLVDVLRQLIAFGGTDVNYTGGKLVAFTFYDNASAFRIQTKCDETGQTFDAIQMPCRE